MLKIVLIINSDTFYVIERFDPCATLAEQLAGVVKSQMGSRRLSDRTILDVPTYKHYINTDRTCIYIKLLYRGTLLNIYFQHSA